MFEIRLDIHHTGTETIESIVKATMEIVNSISTPIISTISILILISYLLNLGHLVEL